MSINDLPVLSALRTKMQWHQERQRVLADNISNSDTPNFKPRDLVEPKFDRNGSSAAGSMGSLAMMRTSAGHIAVTAGRPDAQGLRQPDGLRGRDLALQPQSGTSQNRHWKALTAFKETGSWPMMEVISPAR